MQKFLPKLRSAVLDCRRNGQPPGRNRSGHQNSAGAVMPNLRSVLGRAALFLACGFALAGPMRADSPAVAPIAVSEPSGPVLLTLTGQVEGQTGVTSLAFDQAMLQALPQVTFTTSTIWTDGPQEFTGVPLAALLRAAHMQGKVLEATAANDYAVEIPVENWPDNAPIIAYARNGKPMTIRDKGPLWIIYPYDSDPAYRSEVIYARSIWQLDRIEVRP